MTARRPDQQGVARSGLWCLLLATAGSAVLFTACTPSGTPASRANHPAPTRPASDASSTVTDSTAAPVVLDGIWLPTGVNDRLPMTAGEPLLTPAGRKLLEAHRRAARKGDRSWDTSTRCIPPGSPRIMSLVQPLEITADAHLLAMTFQVQRLVRFVYLDDAYPGSADATYMGDSHGHWDGRVLVVETRNFKPDTVLDGTGLPHGSRLTLVERLELTAPDELTDRMTVSDDEMYMRPWLATVILKRRADLSIQEDLCLERSAPRR